MKKLGFGLMRLPLIDEENKIIDIDKTRELIEYFMKKGYNYFDTAYPYLNGNSEKIVKTLLADRYPRESFVLTSKLPIFSLKSEEDMEKIFNEQLERCGVDYFDYYLLHNVSSKHHSKFTDIDSFSFVKKLKKEGKIRHIGISSHDDSKFLDEILTKHPEIEVVQLQINFMDWNDKIMDSKNCYNVACKHEKQVIIMEGLKGGALVNLPEEAINLLHKYDNEKSIVSWSFRYNLSLNNVMVILSGMNDISHLKENIEIFENFNRLNDEEYNLLDTVVKIVNKTNKIKCTECNYCINYCPQQINILKLFNLYNSQKLLKQSHSLSMYFNNHISLGNKKASDCIKCNSCIKYCPQQINIPKELEKVAETFE